MINMLESTYMPNLVTFAWKMSSGMSKEASSLNGPLCAYLMRQNLHDRACPLFDRFDNDPWKNMDMRVLTRLVCPAARAPARGTTIPWSPWGLRGKMALCVRSRKIPHTHMVSLPTSIPMLILPLPPSPMLWYLLPYNAFDRAIP